MTKVEAGAKRVHSDPDMDDASWEADLLLEATDCAGNSIPDGSRLSRRHPTLQALSLGPGQSQKVGKEIFAGVCRSAAKAGLHELT